MTTPKPKAYECLIGFNYPKAGKDIRVEPGDVVKLSKTLADNLGPSVVSATVEEN